MKHYMIKQMIFILETHFIRIAKQIQIGRIALYAIHQITIFAVKMLLTAN